MTIILPEPDRCDGDDCGATGRDFPTCPWPGCSFTLCTNCNSYQFSNRGNVCGDCGRCWEGGPVDFSPVAILQSESDERRHPYHFRHRPARVPSRLGQYGALILWLIVGALAWTLGWLLAVGVTS